MHSVKSYYGSITRDIELSEMPDEQFSNGKKVVNCFERFKRSLYSKDDYFECMCRCKPHYSYTLAMYSSSMNYNVLSTDTANSLYFETRSK